MRGFVDALKVIKNDKDRFCSLPLIGRNYCDSLFRIEREIGDVSLCKRYVISNMDAAPILNDFHNWLMSMS